MKPDSVDLTLRISTQPSDNATALSKATESDWVGPWPSNGQKARVEAPDSAPPSPPEPVGVARHGWGLCKQRRFNQPRIRVGPRCVDSRAVRVGP